MSEKVIYEVRLIETEDGLRIEMKGDKERMRDFARGHNTHWFGRHGAWKRWAHHGRHFGWGFGPWFDEESDSNPGTKAADESATGPV